MKFGRQVIAAIGALALYVIGLSGYVIVNAAPETPEVGEPLTTTTQAPMPAPSSIPTLVGPAASTERESAKNMALIGGYLNEFWNQQFLTRQPFMAHSWRPITKLYIDTDSTSCGPTDNYSFNDYFCPKKYYVEIGLAPASTPPRNFIIAHEWGHAVQESAALVSGGTASELQADCFAGAFLRYALDRQLLPPSDLDLVQLHAAISAIGDDKSPPVPGTEHGTGAERRSAFDAGWNGNSATCAVFGY